MKKIFLTAALIFATITAFSQARLAVPYADFEKWAKQIKISGYPYLEGEQDGTSYSATLASGPTKALFIRVGNIKTFSDFKNMGPTKDAVVYTWNSHKAVNYFFADVTFLTIELVDAQIAISFGVSGKATKSFMEDIALKSNLQNLKIPDVGQANALPLGIKWPVAVPEEMRINSVESIKSMGEDGTYKDVVEVNAIMGPQLIASVQAILKKYNGDLSFTSTGKVDFICGQAESLEQLQKSVKTGELVSFIYYIK